MHSLKECLSIIWIFDATLGRLERFTQHYLINLKTLPLTFIDLRNFFGEEKRVKLCQNESMLNVFPCRDDETDAREELTLFTFHFLLCQHVLMSCKVVTLFFTFCFCSVLKCVSNFLAIAIFIVMYVCNNKLYSYNTKTNLDMYYDAYYYFYV